MLGTVGVPEIKEYGAHILDSAARSLSLLRRIEDTLVALRARRTIMDALHEVAIAMSNALATISVAIPEEGIVDVLEEGQDALSKIHAIMQSKFAIAQSAPELRSEDSVGEAYEESMASVSRLHGNREDLRWNILQHNARLDGSDACRPISNSQEVLDFLAAL